MTQHTETPYKITIGHNQYGTEEYQIRNNTNGLVAIIKVKSTAEQFVKAVNNHDALVEALKAVCQGKNGWQEVAYKALKQAENR